jgi:hypothetical protein
MIFADRRVIKCQVLNWRDSNLMSSNMMSSNLNDSNILLKNTSNRPKFFFYEILFCKAVRMVRSWPFSLQQLKASLSHANKNIFCEKQKKNVFLSFGLAISICKLLLFYLTQLLTSLQFFSI